MTDKLWKAAERRVAKLIGSERTPLSGGNGKQTRADTLHPGLFIENKHKKRHPLLAVLRDAQQKAKAEGKLAVVSLTETGDGDVYVVLPAEPVILKLLAAEIEKARAAKVQEEGRKRLELAHHEEKPTWTDEFRGGHRE